VPKQHVAVPLLEGVHSSLDALTLRCPTTIGGIECHVLLPAPDPAWTSAGDRDLKAPDDEHEEHDPYWTRSTGWPAARWGYIHHDSVVDGTYTATISAVGLIPVSEPVPWDGKLLDFDEAVGQWRHLLRDWLSVIADGPTGFLDLPVKGETRWADKGYTEEVWTYYYDNLQRPRACQDGSGSMSSRTPTQKTSRPWREYCSQPPGELRLLAIRALRSSTRQRPRKSLQSPHPGAFPRDFPEPA
jgi:hypothetical protein